MKCGCEMGKLHYPWTPNQGKMPGHGTGNDNGNPGSQVGGGSHVAP